MKQIFIFLAVYLIASYYSQTFSSIVLSYEKYSLSSIVNIIKVVVRTLLLVILILFFKYAIIIAIVDMALSIVITAFLWIYCVKKLNVKLNFKHFDKGIFKSILPLCFAIMIQALVVQANSNVDTFIIGIKITEQTDFIVSLYGISLYVFSVFAMVAQIPVTMYAPQVVKDVNLGLEGEELTKTLIQPSRLIILISGSFIFGFIAVGRQFVNIMYGSEFIDAWIVAILIMIPKFISMSNEVVVNVLDAKNKRMARSWILLFTTLANIGLTVWWIDLWGVIGAAAATCVCTVIGQVIMLDIYYSKKIGIKVMKLYWQTYKGILLFQIIACGLGFVSGYFIPSQFGGLFTGIAVYIVVFLTLYLLFGINGFEKELLIKFKNKLFRKKTNTDIDGE